MDCVVHPHNAVIKKKLGIIFFTLLIILLALPFISCTTYKINLKYPATKIRQSMYHILYQYFHRSALYMLCHNHFPQPSLTCLLFPPLKMNTVSHVTHLLYFHLFQNILLRNNMNYNNLNIHSTF